MASVETPVSADTYLRGILAREYVDSSMKSPLRLLEPIVSSYLADFEPGAVLEVYPTGAFEKGLSNASGVVIDFIISFAPTTRATAHELYEALFDALNRRRLQPIRRDVSVALMLEGLAVDLIPAKRESMIADVHELWLTRLERAVKSNLTQHILDAVAAGRREEIRVIKIWRDQQGLDFPSFYLELAVVAALRKRPVGTLAENVWAVFGYLEGLFPARSALDPVNANNIVSDQLSPPGKDAIRRAAQYARKARAWTEIIW